jgi:hypothetical protein
MQNHLAAENTHLSAAQAHMRVRNAELSAGPDTNRPFTIDDLMRLHGLSRHAVIEMYEHEPDVEIDENVERQKFGVRRHRIFRIPRHVYRRVCQRIEVK